MTDVGFSEAPRIDYDRLARRLRARRRRGAALKWAGLAAIAGALALLGLLLATIVSTGWSGFFRTGIEAEAYFDPELIAPEGATDRETIRDGDFRTIVRRALENALGGDVPDDQARRLSALVSSSARYDLRDRVVAEPSLIGTRETMTLVASGEVDQAYKGKVPLDVPEDDRRLTDRQLGWYRTLEDRGRLDLAFDPAFFLRGDSRSPEISGVWTAIVGSAYMLAIVVALAFPIGVAAAVWLEEFAPRNRWTEAVEININNLAAVPSIIFGLIGLAVFLNFFGMPRSSPLAGGAVLTLMTLPIIIIAARSALRAVPPSLREGAIMLGASRQQAVFREVLPVAMPGMLTGTIIGLAQALGETAPLLLIGMVAYVGSAPDGITDSATALPVQIYLWANAPERGFEEKTQAAIMVLLVFLLVMNATAIVLRQRFQKRW